MFVDKSGGQVVVIGSVMLHREAVRSMEILAGLLPSTTSITLYSPVLLASLTQSELMLHIVCTVSAAVEHPRVFSITGVSSNLGFTLALRHPTLALDIVAVMLPCLSQPILTSVERRVPHLASP